MDTHQFTVSETLFLRLLALGVGLNNNYCDSIHYCGLFMNMIVAGLRGVGINKFTVVVTIDST